MNSKAPRWSRRMALLVILVCVGVACDWLGAQALEWLMPTPTLADHMAAEQEYRVPSEVLHHTLKPNWHGRSAFGHGSFELYTNSLGFKDASNRNVSLKSEGPRMLVIGDSFTEGVGVAYEGTFVGKMEEALSKKGIAVLGAGCVSYAPSIYYAKIKYLIDEVGLDVSDVVVFLDISDIHDDSVFYRLTEDGRVVDADDAPSTDEMRARAERQRDSLKAVLKRNSLLIRVVDTLKDVYEAKRWSRLVADEEALMQDLLTSPRSAWTYREDYWDDYGARGMNNVEASLQKLADFLAERGIPLTLAIYPWPTQLAKPDGNDAYRTRMRNFSEARGVQFVDLFPAFESDDPLLDTLSRYFIPWDPHWTNAGHALVAETFLSRFEPGRDPPKRQLRD